MKLQTLNGSFDKVLAAAATITFMISLASPAQAQQGQWYSDGCFYASAQNGQLVRQGCAQIVNGQQRYYDFRSARWSVMTTQGWVDLEAQRANLTARYYAAVQQYRNAQAAAAARAAANQAGDPNLASSYGAGIVGGSGTTSVTSSNPGLSRGEIIITGHTQTDSYGRPLSDDTAAAVNGIAARAPKNIWLAPGCVSSTSGCGGGW